MFIKRLPRFEYHAPGSLPEALSLLSRYGAKAKVFAGGTDLLVAMKKREAVPEHLINLKGIEDLKGMRLDTDGTLMIGGLVTIGEIERSAVIKEKYCALWDAVKTMAAPQIRNLGTIGGNLSSAVPSADTASPLISHGAWVHSTSARGDRKVLVEDFFLGPGQSVLGQDEILTGVFLPKWSGKHGGAYLKLMRRNAMDLALVGVAAFLRFDDMGEECIEARIAMGAVAPTPMRACRAEGILLHNKITDALAEEAGVAASVDANPITDIRASREYRIEMIRVLTHRAVMKACERAKYGVIYE